MQKANNILNDQTLDIKDAALLLLTSLIFSAFFQFTEGSTHNSLPKEEKERTEKLEKEEVREKLSASFSNKNSNGGDSDNDLCSEIATSSHYRLLLSITSKNKLKLYFNVRRSKLFLLFSQLVVYDPIS